MPTGADQTALLEAALAFHAQGIAPIPVRADGTKAPGLAAWKQYQERLPTVEEVIFWFTSGSTDGVGILTGAVSGELEMVEFEGRAVAEGLLAQFDQLADDNGMAGLVERLLAGYCEVTPSGGIHLLYRVTGGRALRNTKLARRPATDDEKAANPNARVQVLAETRGEGGFVVVAPSAGLTHPTGLPWVLRSGSIQTIPVITVDERDMLWALTRMLDSEPAREEQADRTPVIGGASQGKRPGDDFNERADWADILQPEGWKRLWRIGSGYAWRRPGKDTPGISATTGQSADGADRLYVFSSSTELPTEIPMTKFWVYAQYKHGGDMTAAARALAAGEFGGVRFGDEPTQPTASSPVTYNDPADPFADRPPLLTQEASVAIGQAIATAIDSLVDASPEAPAVGTLAVSEDGFSQALISEFGTSVRYCVEMGRWLTWNGWKWQTQPSGGGMVREYAKAVARRYPEDRGWLTHKKRCLSNAGITNAVNLAATDHRVTVSINDLDARPWEMNTPAGIIDLRTGLLGPARPDRLHSKSTTVAPDYDADQGPWLDFLHTTFKDDLELIAFVQRLLGYACIGEVREAILPVFFGEGANGKTVLLETVKLLLGDYATVAPQKFLVQGPAQHATEVAAIAGARLVIASETNEGEKFDEAKVKILTGGDEVKARFMRQDEFTFVPSHMLVMMTNHRPEVGSGGPSFWRRVREIPFDNIVPEDERDPELKERLVTQHGPAIMAWLAQGAALYARMGLAEPTGVKVATKQYEASTDTVAQFVEERLIIGGGDVVKVRVSAVREAYESFCREDGSEPVSGKALTQSLVKRFGIGRTRDASSRFYTGLTLAGASADDSSDPLG